MLDPNKIPPLRRARPLSFADLVEQFGIAGDGERTKALKAASRHDLDRLRKAVEVHADALDEWLAGPEAIGPGWTDEYIAFSAMGMAADAAAGRH
ncbi:hypothetical protein [Variovorax sp. DAIF25]|uniref:hypothetical protein n=1 Tax=Variovorax sp. DAIF25 TaxID=3080983 RepID=UPI003D6BF20E